MRLNKYLSSLGLVSRRKASEWLTNNKLLINDKRVLEPGIQVDPAKDKVSLNSQPIKSQSELVYFIVNKPKGVVSTTDDEFDRKTIISLVKSPVRVYPVGRLDQDSSGLIILTNDGELTNQLTHPRYHVSKTYHALIEGYVFPNQIENLEKSAQLKDGKTQPAKVKFLHRAGKNSWLAITINEGKNRQIRRICGRLNLKILELQRVAIGPIKLQKLGHGQSRELTVQEVESLRELASSLSKRR